MRRGPAPKPTKLKIIAGNPGKRPLNPNEPTPLIVESLEPPCALDEHGQTFWDYYAPKLKEARLLSWLDIHLLVMAALWWSVFIRAMENLKVGITQTSEANGTVAKPEVGTAKQAFNAVRTIMQEFGIGPGSRTKVVPLPPGEEDGEDANDPSAIYFNDGFTQSMNRKRGARRFLA